ncbi:response regulator transcription factor [Candidatus Peregrinibacteria bacterium]|nr:MAG: response regulator transcription factor [Candidatus Peregrinibacteria bacterium]
MHTLIITSQLLHSTLVQDSLKRHNIKSLLCLPSSLEKDWQPQTDALFFPDPLSAKEWSQIYPFLLNVSSKLPLIFLGKVVQDVFQTAPLKRFLKQCLFLDETLSVDEIPIVVKDILLKNPLHEQGKCIQIGDFILDRSQRLASYKKKRSFLTRKEFFLLELLLQNVGQVTTRERIIDYVWDKSSYVGANTIDVYISRLRKKLRVNPKSMLIQTVPCLGYQFSPLE